MPALPVSLLLPPTAFLHHAGVLELDLGTTPASMSPQKGHFLSMMNNKVLHGPPQNAFIEQLKYVKFI
jgi:hypothetical protein